MIKINLLKEEKKGRGISLPSVKGFSKEDLIQEGAIKVLLVIFAIALVAELGYIFTLKRESSSLEAEKNRLVQDRNLWRAKAQRFLNERRDIEAKINRVKARIEYLEKSKDVILTMRKYYLPFNSSLEYVYTNTPSTVWLSSFVQDQSFSNLNLSINFSAYDINTIDEFFVLINKEYSLPLIKSIERKLNKYGITYYVSSIKSRKGISPENLRE